MLRWLRQLLNGTEINRGRYRTRDSAVYDQTINSIIPSQAGVLIQSSLAIIRESTAVGLTAHASGGQQTASPITAQASEFTTVASANDSATLPLTAKLIGVTVSITNAAAANSMNVFPNTGEKINAGAANAAYALAAGKSAFFTCVKSGQWYAVSGS